VLQLDNVLEDNAILMEKDVHGEERELQKNSKMDVLGL